MRNKLKGLLWIREFYKEAVMKIALDKDNNRVYIDDTHVKEQYFCSTCGEELILKKAI